MSDYSKEASRAVIDASKARVLAGLAMDFDLFFYGKKTRYFNDE